MSSYERVCKIADHNCNIWALYLQRFASKQTMKIRFDKLESCRDTQATKNMKYEILKALCRIQKILNLGIQKHATSITSEKMECLNGQGV